MISVIVATFKRSKYLAASIDSILNQSYKDLELIIVPVYGDDDDINIINGYKDNRIKIVCANYALITYQKNTGFYNTSRDSDYMMCFDSDDVMLDGSLAKIYEFASSRNLDVAYPDFYISSRSLTIKKTFVCPEYNHKVLMNGCYIADSSLVKKDTFKGYLPMKVSEGKMRFYNIWKRMSSDKCKISHFPFPTWIYRQHQKNIHLDIYNSQNDSGCVRMRNKDTLKSFYKNIPLKDIENIGINDFCVYFPKPSYFLDNISSFKFKKIVIHWTEPYIELLNQFVDIPYVYHVASDQNVMEYLISNNMKNIKFVNSSSDLEQYLLEEKYQWE